VAQIIHTKGKKDDLFRLFLKVEQPEDNELRASASEVNTPMFVDGKLEISINATYAKSAHADFNIEIILLDELFN